MSRFWCIQIAVVHEFMSGFPHVHGYKEEIALPYFSTSEAAVVHEHMNGFADVHRHKQHRRARVTEGAARHGYARLSVHCASKINTVHEFHEGFAHVHG